MGSGRRVAITAAGPQTTINCNGSADIGGHGSPISKANGPSTRWGPEGWDRSCGRSRPAGPRAFMAPRCSGFTISHIDGMPRQAAAVGTGASFPVGAALYPRAFDASRCALNDAVHLKAPALRFGPRSTGGRTYPDKLRARHSFDHRRSLFRRILSSGRIPTWTIPDLTAS